MSGKLFLIPTPLGSVPENVLPDYNRNIIAGLRHFIVEDIRTARRFLRSLISDFQIDESEFYVLNEHSRAGEIAGMLIPLKNGISMGLMSEAGCPATADPGSVAVNYAHSINAPVIPLVGPSSIILALMASGLNGQNFAFIGYLPAKKEALEPFIRKIEERSIRENQTQIFIETPYRNLSLFQSLVSTLKPETRLSLAIDLTLDTQEIKQQTVREWKKTSLPDLHKRLVIFLIGV
jgi:16S rRNA (cytidine1402-2'-O)-methyltransferase